MNDKLSGVAQLIGVSVPVAKFFSSLLAGYVFAILFVLVPKPRNVGMLRNVQIYLNVDIS